MKKHSGFTLVELIITLVIIAVLAVTAAPKFISLNDEQAPIIQKEFISILRQIQLKAFNNPGYCFQVNVTQSSYQSARYSCDSNTGVFGTNNPLLGTEHTLPAETRISFEKAISFALVFDSLGRITNCNNAQCIISINSGNTAQVYIEPEGYIHGGS